MSAARVQQVMGSQKQAAAVSGAAPSSPVSRFTPVSCARARALGRGHAWAGARNVGGLWVPARVAEGGVLQLGRVLDQHPHQHILKLDGPAGARGGARARKSWLAC